MTIPEIQAELEKIKAEADVAADRAASLYAKLVVLLANMSTEGTIELPDEQPLRETPASAE